MIRSVYETCRWKSSTRDDLDTDTDIENLIEEIDELDEEPSHKVVLFNDDFHVFSDVVHIVSYATGKDLLQSYEVTLEAHNKGRAICYAGSLDECRKVGFILMNGGLIVEVD